MNWHIFAIGKPKLSFAREGVEEYAKRLRGPLASVAIEYLKPAAAKRRARHCCGAAKECIAWRWMSAGSN